MLTTHSATVIAAYAAISAYLVNLDNTHHWYKTRITTPVKHWHIKRNKNSYKKSRVPLLSPEQYKPWTIRTNEDKQTILTDMHILNAHRDNANVTTTPDESILIFDTGASCTIVNSLDDFIELPRPVQTCKIKGIAAGLDIEAVGTVSFKLTTDKGEPF